MGVFKKQFKMLNTPIEFVITTVCKLIYVTLALDNFIRKRVYDKKDL